MIVLTQYIMKIQELVELQDLNKTYINMPFIVLLLKVDFGEIIKLFTIWQSK